MDSLKINEDLKINDNNNRTSQFYQWIIISLMLIALPFLSSCGLHLRGMSGSYKLPFKSVYLQCSDVVICANLTHVITSQNLTKLVDSPNKAETIIRVFNEQTSRDPQAFNSVGRIAAYILTYQATAQVWQNGEQVNNDIVISTQAVMQYNDSIILASNQNETSFWDNLHENATNQLIRRLVAFNPNISNNN
jgi:outer membrane lipopolysaccharide assembly protein LptE/RlpB